jgi:LruC domain-containing protein
MKKILLSIFSFALVSLMTISVFSTSAIATVCDITKANGGGFSTTVKSVVCNPNGTYTIILRVEHDGCGGPECKALSHYSVEADPGTYSNISVSIISGGMTYSNIDNGPNLGSDPFQGFKIDNVSGIGGGAAGIFEITYTLTSLQDQQVSAKAGTDGQIASFTVAEFTSVMNCNGTGCGGSITGPTAVDDNATTPMNTPVDITILSNDIQGTGALVPSSVTFVSGTAPAPSVGVFTKNSLGVVTFTPATGYHGTATIEYQVCDVNSLCDIALITVTIPPAITGPTAVDDSKTTSLNTPVDIDILDNDIPGTGALVPSSVTFIAGTEPPVTVGVFTVNSLGVVTFTPALNYHGTATIEYKVCDVNSLCDIALITVTIPPPGTDTDGDGCTDDVDDYPMDPTRCFDNYFPAGGKGTLAYEDLWPAKGDYDFNDLVCDYRFKTVTNNQNKVVEIFGTFTIKAFGANFHNGFGFQLPNNNVDLSDLTVTGYDIRESYINLASNGLEQGQAKPTIIVYDDAYNLMPHPGQGIGVNTTPGAPYVQPVTLTIHMAFSTPKYTMNQVKINKFNPFIIVDKTRGIEVHLPDYAPTSLANPGYFGQVDDDTDLGTGKYYKTESNLPWAININKSFAYPKEKVEIINAYNHFVEWATSGGTLYPDWYKNLSGYRNAGNIYQIP